MRSLFLLVIALGACDLQPPPKKKPPVATTPTDVPTPPPSAPTPGSAAAPTPTPTPTPPEPGLPPAPVDAAVVAPPVDAFETTAACNEVGVKIAASIIDNAPDPAQKATLTQERDRIVRRVSEACTRDKWSQASRDCFLKAKTPDEMQICGKDLAAPRDN